jgi:hypothetical protein
MDTRQQFEAWAKDHVDHDGLSRFTDSSPNFPGEYIDWELQDFWLCWQAATTAALEACALVCERVDLHSGDVLKNSDPRVTCAAAIRARDTKQGGETGSD